MVIILLLAAVSALANQLIGDIEFYGYQGLDVRAVSDHLPVRPGDALTDDVKHKLQDAVTSQLGKAPTDINAVCCNEQGNFVIFIGLPGGSNALFSYNPLPSRSIRLPKEVTSLYDQLQQASWAAVQAGGTAPQEDDSNGYALINYPPARSLQLAARSYAIQHEEELIRVLERSSDAHQRQAAAWALGYSKQSRKQISALIGAARDADSGVRNDATRALMVLASSSTQIADEIPAEPFLQMMHSGVWTDRNKGVAVLLQLTRTRNPKVLREVRTGALEPLIEMAKWKDTGHALPARLILGRVAGLSESQASQLAVKGDIEPILKALGTGS